MTRVARGLAEQGIRVVRFEFPYMRRGGRGGSAARPTASRCCSTRGGGDAELRATRKIAIGGKSMGGRMASLVADEAGVAALVCFGYPFHPPGSPTSLRTAHLKALKTPALIVQGTRDTFGSRRT